MNKVNTKAIKVELYYYTDYPNLAYSHLLDEMFKCHNKVMDEIFRQQSINLDRDIHFVKSLRKVIEKYIKINTKKLVSIRQES